MVRLAVHFYEYSIFDLEQARHTSLIRTVVTSIGVDIVEEQST
jgi:hypothetical protein